MMKGFRQRCYSKKFTPCLRYGAERKYVFTNEDIKAIRYHLFPEVRISAEFRQPAYYQDQLLLSLHNIKAMDLHQENMAKQIGDRHRLIRGVAG
jgi:hypothetical protein